MVLLIAGSVHAQEYTTIKDFTLIGNDAKNFYLVNVKDAKYTDGNIAFTMIAGRIKELGPDVATPDPDHHEFMLFVGNCATFEFSAMRFYGKNEGKPYKSTLTPKVETATTGTAIYEGMKEVCLTKIGESLNIERKGTVKP